ncbi:MAG: hypothetical protein NDJ89_17130 [Oligoflexia bacterium]|nr:hypothetical protein [Oligoflexia bacterium]
MKRAMILTLMFCLPGSAHAISYYKFDGDKVKKVEEAEFSQCGTVIYRDAAKEELPVLHKRKLLAALLKGETVNDLGAALKKLKRAPGTCSYGTDSEVFQ